VEVISAWSLSDERDETYEVVGDGDEAVGDAAVDDEPIVIVEPSLLETTKVMDAESAAIAQGDGQRILLSVPKPQVRGLPRADK
jgi:hypothetical protein